jgi:hypothetical protein
MVHKKHIVITQKRYLIVLLLQKNFGHISRMEAGRAAERIRDWQPHALRKANLRLDGKMTYGKT